MPRDNKYGQVTIERGTIRDDEPVMIFRAQDALAPRVIRAYREMCREAGSPQRHLMAIDDALSSIEAWQADNPIQTPSSDGYTPRNLMNEAPPDQERSDARTM
jgi:hypothetical protein